jgi:hypothetical protein
LLELAGQLHIDVDDTAIHPTRISNRGFDTPVAVGAPLFGTVVRTDLRDPRRGLRVERYPCLFDLVHAPEHLFVSYQTDSQNTR